MVCLWALRHLVLPGMIWTLAAAMFREHCGRLSFSSCLTFDAGDAAAGVRVCLLVVHDWCWVVLTNVAPCCMLHLQRHAVRLCNVLCGHILKLREPLLDEQPLRIMVFNLRGDGGGSTRMKTD